MSIYDLQNANYRYQEVLALDSVTCAIERGERIAILGANGSGKSTLLRLLDGLYFAQSGSVSFEGRELNEESLQDENFVYEFRKRVGFVFQNPDVQLFNPTVFDELAFGPLQLRWSRKQIIEAVDIMLERMNLMHLKHRVPHRLSGGEKKRVALASVLMLDPEVLLLDEPTAYLDPKSQSQMIDFLVECQHDKTVITATHDLEIVGDIAERCIVFEEGRVAQSGTPSQILGDESLLRRTSLIHEHRHRHGSDVHKHPHLHKFHTHIQGSVSRIRPLTDSPGSP
ncbi:MAG: ABC transporter ATP-binding protein [bacterium]